MSIQLPAADPPETVIQLMMEAALLSPLLLNEPPASVSIVRLGLLRNMFAVEFSVARTSDLGVAKDQLLLSIRRQLHRSGLHGTDHPSDGDLAPTARTYALRQTGLFDALSPDELDTVVQQVSRCKLAKGDRLFSQGEADPSLYVIASGVLKISVLDDDGIASPIGRLGVGDFVGEECLFTGAPYPASAVALTPCDVHRLSADALTPLMLSDPQMMPAFDTAVRTALDHIHRGAAAKIGRDAATAGPFIDRIYGFFRHSRG